jgi:hypothetical protein
MPHDAVRPTPHEAPVGRRETEGPAQGKERHNADPKPNHLHSEPDIDPPVDVRSDRPEKNTTERSAKGEEPVAPPAAHRARRTPDQVGDDNPTLLDKEPRSQQSVGMKVRPQSRVYKERSAARSDNIRKKPNQANSAGTK